MNSNWSYDPETDKWDNDLCDLDLDINIVKKVWRMDRRTQTDGRTDGRKEVFLELLSRS